MQVLEVGELGREEAEEANEVRPKELLQRHVQEGLGVALVHLDPTVLVCGLDEVVGLLEAEDVRRLVNAEVDGDEEGKVEHVAS